MPAVSTRATGAAAAASSSADFCSAVNALLKDKRRSM